MNTSKITLPTAVMLSLVIGFGAGYWLFRDVPPALRDDLSLAVNSLVNSKTPTNWSVQLSGTVKSWEGNVMELQGKGGAASVRVVADSNAQFIDSTLNQEVFEPKSFAPNDIRVGDTLEVTTTFDKNALLRAAFINKVATP